MKKIVALQFLLSFALSAKWDCADYYWRDYNGKIPKDAIPAGNDSEGNALYLGVAYIRGYEFLPVTIYPKQQIAATTAYSVVLHTSQNVKILCGPDKEPFQWVSIQSQNLHEYFDKLLIPGGSEVGEDLYIGRVFRDKSAIVGKVFKHERSNRGIWFMYNNGPQNSLTYEILLYDCSKKSSKISPFLDIRILDKPCVA